MDRYLAFLLCATTRFMSRQQLLKGSQHGEPSAACGIKSAACRTGDGSPSSSYSLSSAVSPNAPSPTLREQSGTSIPERTLTTTSYAPGGLPRLATWLRVGPQRWQYRSLIELCGWAEDRSNTVGCRCHYPYMGVQCRANLGNYNLFSQHRSYCMLNCNCNPISKPGVTDPDDQGGAEQQDRGLALPDQGLTVMVPPASPDGPAPVDSGTMS